MSTPAVEKNLDPMILSSHKKPVYDIMYKIK